MCKWNKFRSNNSTTIPLQSADSRERILRRCATVPETQTTILALSGSRPADGFGPILLSRSVPNLFHFIALLIHKFLFNLICRHCYGNKTKRGALSLEVSPSSSLFLPFLLLLLFLCHHSTCFHPLLSFHDRRLLEKDISRLSLILNAPLRLTVANSPRRRCYVMRIKIFQIYEAMSLRIPLHESLFFFESSSGFDSFDMKKNILIEKMCTS